jgi:hypothetical protein
MGMLTLVGGWVAGAFLQVLLLFVFVAFGAVHDSAGLGILVRMGIMFSAVVLGCIKFGSLL